MKIPAFIKNIILVCSLVSCTENNTSIHHFTNKNWPINDTIKFTFEINDIASNYNLSFFFRNNLDYEYRNLYLFANILLNNNLIKVDTLQYEISDKYGKWLGRGLGKIRDNYFIYEKDLNFEEEGNYQIELMHGMRKNKLVGCNKFGFKIKQSE